MRRWVVRDRDGREIYMPEERWGHITVRHEELDGHLDNVLDTLRWGKRRETNETLKRTHTTVAARA